MTCTAKVAGWSNVRETRVPTSPSGQRTETAESASVTDALIVTGWPTTPVAGTSTALMTGGVAS